MLLRGHIWGVPTPLSALLPVMSFLQKQLLAPTELSLSLSPSPGSSWLSMDLLRALAKDREVLSSQGLRTLKI